jgi:hypothetical protein
MLKTNANSFLDMNENVIFDDIKRDLTKRVKRAAELMHRLSTSKVPVWKGTALANMQWSTGAPATGVVDAAGGSKDPGPTNSMRVGSEPRRPENQAISDASFARLNFSNPFQEFILTNNAPHMRRIEFGLPPRDGLKARAPKGVFRVSALEVEARMKAEGLL